MLPLFTVIIPQKNRSEYLEYTLKSCMIQEYPNFEIIVSDDCSTDDSVELVKSLMERDSRIKLFAHNAHLGMRNNFEFALNQVKPGFVLALGGDDGLVFGCIERMYEILSSTGKDLLTWSPAGFTYPKEKGGKNIVHFKRTKFKGVRIINSHKFLSKLSQSFFYQVDDCPMLYMKGVVSTDIINKVKSRSLDGNFYSCSTPDGYSGIVLAGEVENYVYTNEPLTIGGDSIKSQGRNYTSTEKEARKEAEQFFNDNLNRKMHRMLASQEYSPLVTLMTADFLLTAQDLPGWPGKFSPISFEALIVATFKLMETTEHKHEVLIRELKILKAIAEQHDLLELYNNLLSTTKRRMLYKEEIYGTVITNSIRFDGSEIGIKNIYDASVSMNVMYKIYNKISFNEFIHIVKNTFRIFNRKWSYKLEKLPNVN